jgi:hypothetical protein
MSRKLRRYERGKGLPCAVRDCHVAVECKFYFYCRAAPRNDCGDFWCSRRVTRKHKGIQHYHPSRVARWGPGAAQDDVVFILLLIFHSFISSLFHSFFFTPSLFNSFTFLFQLSTFHSPAVRLMMNFLPSSMMRMEVANRRAKSQTSGPTGTVLSRSWRGGV